MTLNRMTVQFRRVGVIELVSIGTDRLLPALKLIRLPCLVGQTSQVNGVDPILVKKGTKKWLNQARVQSARDLCSHDLSVRVRHSTDVHVEGVGQPRRSLEKQKRTMELQLRLEV